MATARSYLTPQGSVSTFRDGHHPSESSSNADLFYSLAPMGQSVSSSPMTANSVHVQHNRLWTPADTEENSLSSNTDPRRAREHRILFVMNLFRLVLIVVLAPMLYFLV